MDAPESSPQWQRLRPSFIRQIESAAESLNVELRWLSHRWIAMLGRPPRTAAIVGYTFPLNNAASAQLATDKVAAFETLRDAGVPALTHFLVRFPWKGTEPGEAAVCERVTSTAVHAPVVIKPHADGGGVDVRRALSEAELQIELTIMASRHRAVAVSPWAVIDAELRVVVLDDVVMLAFYKQRQPPVSGDGEWRHNLRFGAAPAVIDVATLDRPVAELARGAMTTLGLRFAAVDVISVEGSWRVLEVNSGVCLERFSAASPRHHALAGEVYRSAVAAMFS